MCRAALGFESSLSSLGEGGLRALLVAGVLLLVASRSSRRFVLHLRLDVVSPPVGAHTAVTRLFTCLDSTGWFPLCTCVRPPPRLPSAECHRRLLLRASHHWPRCLHRTRLVLAPLRTPPRGLFPLFPSPPSAARTPTSFVHPARPDRRESQSVVY